MVRPGVAASCLTLVLVLVTIWSQAQPEKVRQVGQVGQVRLAAQTGEILHQAFLPTPQPQPLFSLSLPARNLRLPALTMRGVSSVFHLSLSLFPTLPPLVSLSTVSRARATCRKASSRLCFSPLPSLPPPPASPTPVLSSSGLSSLPRAKTSLSIPGRAVSFCQFAAVIEWSTLIGPGRDTVL